MLLQIKKEARCDADFFFYRNYFTPGLKRRAFLIG
jgi:hypothetical protein